jgi:two-component system, chemotaxis family, sensor kinase CheA
MAEGTDKAREEFLSEAQELIEGLSRSLLALDELQTTGSEDPALVNEAFRYVHTLKGLSGIFSAKAIGTLAHRVEDALDALRLGKLALSSEFIDVLLRTVELFWQLLSHEKEGDEPPDLQSILARLRRLTSETASHAGTDDFEFEPALLAVLTEYEEHRLRTCVERGLDLFKVRVRFGLATLDKELDEVKLRLAPLGEVITYLPTGEAASLDAIELDLLLASGSDTATIVQAAGGPNVVVEQVPRRAPDSGSGGGKGSSLEPQTSRRTALPTAHPDSELSPAAAIRSVSQTVRVDIRKLDVLMNAVGELAILRGALARMSERLRADGARQLASELHRIHRSFDRRLSELQNGILEVRMVPLSQVFDRLTRVVRQISRDVDKSVRLVVTGSDTEIDKLIVEELSDPLMHIVRNAIDHGIESRERRAEMGKPEVGIVALNAFQKGNHVVLEIEDDGGGIDEKFLIERAVASGHVAPQEASELSRDEIMNLIFLPGVTTRQEVSDYSGRGVGMDVVKTNIAKLGGVIDLHSERNIGTKITVTLPITLAIVSALLVRCAGNTFALPLNSVSEAFSLDTARIKWIDSREVYTLRGASLPLCRIDSLLELPPLPASNRRRRFVVVATLGARRLGLVTDELLGQEDIVIKSLGKSLKQVRGFAGATELGDQRVALVLDVAAIIEEVLRGSENRELLGSLHG